MFDKVFTMPLSDCLPDSFESIGEVAGHLCTCMNALGMHTCFDLEGDWVKLTVQVNGTGGQLAIRLPEVAGLPSTGLPFRVGTSTAFGVPSGKPFETEPEHYVYLPAGFTFGGLVNLALGQFLPSEYMQLQNFSVRYAMSIPRTSFPKSILLMQGERLTLKYRGDQCFELWTQTAAGVEIRTLSGTGCPHKAAAEAAEMGFYPTIYLCLSGTFVTFKQTDAGVFLGSTGD